MRNANVQRFRLVRAILCIAVLAHAAVPLRAEDEPRISAKLEAEKIYDGETLRYQVTIHNLEKPPSPELAPSADFDVVLLGEKSLNSRMVRIVNGQVRERVEYGRAYIYRLTPRRAGVLRVPEASATVDGRTLRGPVLELTVVAPQDQDVVRMAITVDRTTVYPLQPFVATLTLRVKALPAPHEGRDPLGVQETRPSLTVPWADELPEGLALAGGERDWLERWETRDDAGFTVNARNSSFFGPGAYRPPPQRVRQPDRNGVETAYWEYSMPVAFVATRPGAYEFGPATLKGTFATGVDPKRQRLAGEEIYVVARKVTVTVREVPRDGRPADFTGAVGRFQIEAALSPTRARVGDPMTLVLTLSGEGLLDAAAPPDLSAIPDIAKSFRTYEGTAETKSGRRLFTYTLRPTAAGVEAFPPVTVSVFDVEREAFVTLATREVPISVVAAETMSGGEIVSGARETGPRASRWEARKEGIFANITDLAALRDDAVRPDAWWSALFGILALYGAAAWLSWRWRRARDPEVRRRRAAIPRARARIEEARAHLDAGRPGESAEAVRASLTGLVGDALGIDPAGLTPREVRAHLEVLGVPETAASACAETLEACDAVRYGAGSAAAAPLLARIPRDLENLIAALRGHGRLG